jgi:RimJ/RimL family protein N-acetyltransferase
MDTHPDQTIDAPVHAALLDSFDTARLHLRRIDAGDEALYCQLYTDPALMRHIASPMTMEAAKRSFVVACRQHAWMKQRWILVDRSGTAPTRIGLLGLIVDVDTTDVASAEIGVMLREGWQGRGFAAEAIMAMAARAFDAGALECLWTRHAPDNPLATGLMEKLRFQREGLDDADPPQRRWTLPRSRWLQVAANHVAVATANRER